MKQILADDPQLPLESLPTMDQMNRALSQVETTSLSPDLQNWIARYDEIGDRPPFLWKWCRRATEITTLSFVPNSMIQAHCDLKLLAVMWDVVVDDLADNGGDEELLDELLLLPLRRCNREFSEKNRKYGSFACEIWDELNRRLQDYIGYDDFSKLLRFDYLQLCNSMRYSHLVHYRPEFMNLPEHDLYTPANMSMMICSTMDLMTVKDFPLDELGNLREAIGHAQWMGRIGNLITTWERELKDRDFSSGVFARAMSSGHLSTQTIRGQDQVKIQDAVLLDSPEEFYHDLWAEHGRSLLLLDRSLPTVDVQKLVSGLRELYCLHLTSRGKK